MNETKSQRSPQGDKADPKTARQTRLNEALRENLKKRKAQARARRKPGENAEK